MQMRESPTANPQQPGLSARCASRLQKQAQTGEMIEQTRSSKRCREERQRQRSSDIPQHQTHWLHILLPFARSRNSSVQVGESKNGQKRQKEGLPGSQPNPAVDLCDRYHIRSETRHPTRGQRAIHRGWWTNRDCCKDTIDAATEDCQDRRSNRSTASEMKSRQSPHALEKQRKCRHAGAGQE